MLLLFSKDRRCPCILFLCASSRIVAVVTLWRLDLTAPSRLFHLTLLFLLLGQHGVRLHEIPETSGAFMGVSRRMDLLLLVSCGRVDGAAIEEV